MKSSNVLVMEKTNIVICQDYTKGAHFNWPGTPRSQVSSYDIDN